jgi:hypothetical protein
MLFNRSVFKSFYRSLVDGVFNLPVNKGATVPPEEDDNLIDNAGDLLLDIAGDQLVAPVA